MIYYSIIRHDRNRKGRGFACYFRNDLCFNTKNISSSFTEHEHFELFIAKVKAIAIGIFFIPQNANYFLNTFSNVSQQVDTKTNETYLLGVFDTNLLQNGKFISKEN